MRTLRRHHPALSAPARLERLSIIITIVSNLTLGLLGLVISLVSSSGAVFLDGVFSLIFAMVGLLTLYVSGLVLRPRDDQYPFGYATFEPMLNLFKGILIAFALIFAAWNAVSALAAGGKDVAAGGAVVYAAIAVTAGGLLATTLRILANRSRSPIVEVDARNSLIDTFISAAVGIAFVITLLLQNSRWAPAARYADPAIILLIAVLAAPQPIRIIRSNWRQLLGRAPARATQDLVSDTIKQVLASVPHSETCLRLTEVGRYIYLHLYVIVPDNARQPIGIKIHDQVRRRVYDALAAEFRYLALDISFTSDLLWAYSSFPSAHHTTPHGAAQPTER